MTFKKGKENKVFNALKVVKSISKFTLNKNIKIFIKWFSTGTVVLSGGLSRRGKPRGPPGSKDLKRALKGCDDPLFLDFIQRCLEWDPDIRMTPGQALRHAWLRRRLPRPPGEKVRKKLHIWIGLIYDVLKHRLIRVVQVYQGVDLQGVLGPQKPNRSNRFHMVREMHDVVDTTFCIGVALKVKLMVKDVVWWLFGLHTVGCNSSTKMGTGGTMCEQLVTLLRWIVWGLL